MNSWFVWITFAVVAIVLSWIGYFFSLRVLRVAAAIVALATAVYLTWYGLTHPAKPPGSLSGAFTQSTDALIRAFFHLQPVPPGSPGPGWIGLLVIAVLLVIGYRELEALSQHCHARSLDTSELTRVRQTDQSGDGKDAPADVQRHAQQTDSSGDGTGALTDVQRHDRLAAELKFWLPAVDVRAPAILPGGSRSSALASIAEASGVNGSGLAGAIIRFFGMLWPSPRRVRVRVWVKGAAVPAKIDTLTRVAVCLDDPGTGESIGTKTLAASSLDNAACVAAGYVARRIFAGDPTVPPWSIGVADGGDLAAMLLTRHERVYPETEYEVTNARYTKIGLLEEVAWSSQCAGVARYELAHLYDLTDDHVKALALHATNREQYKRFYRGRYRLAMSLEMIASSDLGEKERDTFNDVLRILDRWDGTADESEKHRVEDGKPVLSPPLRPYLLDAAQKELREIRRYLTLRDVIWQSIRHRNEREVLKPYWRLRHRQSFHDGVCLAQLLVAVRQQTLNSKKKADPLPHGLARLLPHGLARLRVAVRQASKADPPPHGPVQLLVAVRQILKADPLPRPHKVLRIATAIADDSSCIANLLGIRYKPGRPWRQGHPPRMVKRLRTRRWPRQYSTTSWPAAYNLACVYAAICAHPHQLQACMRKTKDDQAQDDAEQIKRLVGKVVTSLEFAITNRECEMERPSEWITHDPDFDCLRSGDQFSQFTRFLKAQTQRDYPLFTSQPGAAAAQASPQNNLASMQSACQDAAAIYRDTGDRHGEGSALNNLGLALREVGRFEEAIAACQDAAAIFRDTGDRQGEAGALNNLGNALSEVGQFDQAITACQAAAAIFRATGDRRGEVGALNDLGVALQGVRRFDLAITAHQDAAAIYRDIGDRHREAMALDNLGNALREVGRFDEAITASQDAAAILGETGDRHDEAMALNNLGLALRNVGRIDQAITACQDAAAIFRDTGDRYREGVALNSLGRALQEAGRLDEAITRFQDAAAILGETGARHVERVALGNLGAAKAARQAGG